MKNFTNKVYLLLGGNLQDVEKTFKIARVEIAKNIGEITTQSEEYSSKAWGFESENIFLNQVIIIETKYSSSETLSRIQTIEAKLGRIRNPGVKGFESRLIDIDILYYNSDIVNTKQLTIPHYAMHERRFTLTPLVEIAPLFIHPIFKKSNQELLESCSDTNTVTIK